MLHRGTEGAVDELPGKRVLVLSAIQGDSQVGVQVLDGPASDKTTRIDNIDH